MIEQIMDFLGSNQLASGGLLIASFTAFLAFMRDVPNKVWTFIKRRTVLEIEVLEKDPAYAWMMKYIHENKLCKKSRKLTAMTTFRRGHGGGVVYHDDSDTTDEGEGEDDKIPEVFLVPAPGLHFFWFKNIPVILNMVRQEPSGRSSLPRQEIRITTLYRWKYVIEGMLSEARVLKVSKKKTDKLVMLYPASYGWNEGGECEMRDLETLFLEKGKKEEIIKDIDTFRNSKEWYNNIGIPYKRGYLLYGPPGNGKTSLVKAIATHFKLKLCILPLEGLVLTETTILDLFQDSPTNSMLLIEDVDCAVGKRDSKDNKVPMSVLLNCLDGISSPEGKMFFMTTNHKEKLDEALIRSGRCDFRMFLGNADRYQIEGMFAKFFPEHGDLSGLELPEGGICVATVQEHLLRHRDSWENALKAFGSMFK